MTRHTLDSDSEADVAALAAAYHQIVGIECPGPPDGCEAEWLAPRLLDALPASPALLIDRERLAARAWENLEAGSEMPWIDVPDADARRAELVAWVHEVADAYERAKP